MHFCIGFFKSYHVSLFMFLRFVDCFEEEAIITYSRALTEIERGQLSSGRVLMYLSWCEILANVGEQLCNEWPFYICADKDECCGESHTWESESDYGSRFLLGSRLRSDEGAPNKGVHGASSRLGKKTGLLIKEDRI